MSELLGANTGVLERNAESLSTAAKRVQDIRTLAQRAVTELQASWNGSDLIRLTQLWEQQASPLLAGASASLDTCAAQLRAQSGAQTAASSIDDAGFTAIPTSMTAPAPPPTRGEPAANATWWRSLSTLQQERVIREHPQWIGNLDGVSFTARDLANQSLLITDRIRLLAQKEHLQAVLRDDWSSGVLTNDDAMLSQVQEKLKSIHLIEATLALGGARHLVLLDLSPERAQAAIANGNIETADHVAVFVPGMSSNVAERMKDYDAAMSHLQESAQSESIHAQPGQYVTTATVTWIGYQAPEEGLDLLNPDKSALSDRSARKGAALLVPFLRGIDASRDHDAHLTLLSHSYGSTTAALALRKETGVNDAVFFGSPGLNTNHVQDLLLAPAPGHLTPGHAYYIEARDDPVGDAGAFGLFGIDPSHLDGIEHASARASTVVDPGTGEIRHLSESTGHGQYLDVKSTSQQNISLVVAGVPDRVVHDSGEGLGDVLSWPIPGTYR